MLHLKIRKLSVNSSETLRVQEIIQGSAITNSQYLIFMINKNAIHTVQPERKACVS